MTSRRDLLDAVRNASTKLAAAAVWPNTRPVSGRTDFVYETYVLTELLISLRAAGWGVTVRRGSGANAHRLPQKPAVKANGWASFVVVDPATHAAYEVCAGTRIKDVSDDERAPDISVQTPVGVAKPTYAHVWGIYDAKFRQGDLSAITSPEFSEFARWLQVLAQGGRSPPWSVPCFDRSALITNGRPSTETDKERNRTGVVEIGRFKPGTVAIDIRPAAPASTAVAVPKHRLR